MPGEKSLADSAAAQFDTGQLRKGSASCPVSHRAAAFDPFKAPFLDDPYPFLQETLREEPVFYSPEIDHWVITRYNDVRAVFQNPAVFSAANTLSAVTPMSPEVLKCLRDSGFRMNPVLTNLDPPAHVRIRKHAANAFSHGRVAESEGWIRELTDRFIDRLLEKTPDDRGLRHANMVAEFAYDLPAHVAFRFLCVPDSEVHNIKAWTRNRVFLTWGRCDESAQLREVEGLIAMWKFCERHVAATMEADTPGFLGDLTRHHRAHPDELSVNEIESILFTMLVAGHETTSNAIASALATLLGDRRLWERLIDDPALVPNTVEEMLRFRPSIISWRRIATQDAELQGTRIPAGGRILLMLAGANHDPEHFPEPESVDLDRQNARQHISFGHGAHLCIGAGLARLEMKVFLEQLTRRLPGLMLDQPQSFDYLPNLSFRGPAKVLVHWC